MYLTNDRSLIKLPPDQLQDVIDNLDIPVWLYAAAKAAQHGSCYGMKGLTMSNNILRQSWKKAGEVIYVKPKDCMEFQDIFFTRYGGVKKWQGWVKLQLEQYGELPCASGHTRRFFGRRNDHNTLMAAYAHEPQANTTYATALAAERLWLDPTNRTPDDRFIVEPLHQVHDELCGQFPRDKADWAVSKIREWFHNKIIIAEQEIVIPYEGEYGDYWTDNSGGII